MKPWDPIINAGEMPVAPPIHVKDLPEDDLEALWWAHLLGALHGLRMAYHRMGDTGQVYRTGRIQAKALDALKRLYLSMAEGINRAGVKAAAMRATAWDWHQDPLPLETGWWAQAAACAHALAAGYAFTGGVDDARALLAADLLKAIRERVLCALPENIGAELLDLATATQWNQAPATGPAAGTPAAAAIEETKLEKA